MNYLNDHITHKSGAMKTVCTSAVLAHFNITPKEYHYSAGPDDLKRILNRKGYSVRSRMSALKAKGKTIGQLRAALKAHDGSKHTRYYVGVPGHAMLLNGRGETVVDTDPRKRDRRKIVHVNLVKRKDGQSEVRLSDLTDFQVELLIQAKKEGRWNEVVADITREAA